MMEGTVKLPCLKITGKLIQLFSLPVLHLALESLQVPLSLTGKLELIFLVWQMFISQAFVSILPSCSQMYVPFRLQNLEEKAIQL